VHMAESTLYIDESYSSRVFVLAGYIAPDSRWHRFKERWASLLSAEGHFTRENGIEVVLPFHMTDFESRQKAYAQWDEAKRVRIIKGLIDIINETFEYAFTVALPLEILKRECPSVLMDRPKQQLLTKYMLCLNELYGYAAHVTPWIPKLSVVSGVVSEVDSTVRRDLADILRGVEAVRFEDKSVYTPLQAADILAYEEMKRFDNHVLGNGKISAFV